MYKPADKSKIAGTDEFYYKLYDMSDYIYIGKVTSILKNITESNENLNLDSDYAYVTISQGWKNGRQKQISLKASPYLRGGCTDPLFYRLEESKSYLFFESRKER